MMQSESKCDGVGIMCGVIVILVLMGVTCSGVVLCACSKGDMLLKHNVSNGMGNQVLATGCGGVDSTCIDFTVFTYSQSVLMTSCVRNESVETIYASGPSESERYAFETGKNKRQENGKRETIAEWRRFCRLLSRKNGEYLSPSCLDELIKAQALKFSCLHRLDQLIQCRAQKLNSSHIYSAQFVNKNNTLCYADGNDCYSYKSMTWCGKSLFHVQRETRNMRRRRKHLEKQAAVDGHVESKRLKCERQEERLDEIKTLLWIDKIISSLESEHFVVPDSAG